MSIRLNIILLLSLIFDWVGQVQTKTDGPQDQFLEKPILFLIQSLVLHPHFRGLTNIFYICLWRVCLQNVSIDVKMCRSFSVWSGHETNIHTDIPAYIAILFTGFAPNVNLIFERNGSILCGKRKLLTVN